LGRRSRRSRHPLLQPHHWLLRIHPQGRYPRQSHPQQPLHLRNPQARRLRSHSLRLHRTPSHRLERRQVSCRAAATQHDRRADQGRYRQDQGARRRPHPEHGRRRHRSPCLPQRHRFGRDDCWRVQGARQAPGEAPFAINSPWPLSSLTL
ncbi:hypothetical protein FRC00_010550, partial [Tulasnella sp. 408]